MRRLAVAALLLAAAAGTGIALRGCGASPPPLDPDARAATPTMVPAAGAGIANDAAAVRRDAAAAVADRLGGVVVDGDGAPVADAEVSAVVLATGAVTATRSAADGGFSLAAAPAVPLRLVAAHPAFLITTAAVDAPRAPVPLRLVLQRPPIVRGRVLDPAGRPIARSCVALLPLEEGELSPIASPPPGAEWRSRDDGAFELVARQVGPHALQVFTERGRPTQHRLELQAAAVVEQDVRIERGVLVRGIVRDAAGAAVVEARVALQLVPDGAVAFALTNGDGTFALEPLSPGRAVLQVEATDAPLLRRDDLALSSGEPEPFFELQLPAGAAVAGRVQPWLPGQQAEVVLAHVDGPVRRAAVDATAGTFALGGLTPGEHRVFVDRLEPSWRNRVAHQLQDHATAARVALVAGTTVTVDPVDPVAAMARVRGTVVGDAAPDRLLVRAFREDAALPDRVQGLFRAVPTRDGAFELDGFVAGRWRLQVMRADDVLAWEVVEVSAGADLQVALRLGATGR